MRIHPIVVWGTAAVLMIIMGNNETEAICCHGCFSHPFKWFPFQIPRYWPRKICTLNTCDTEDPDDGSYNPCAVVGQFYCSINGTCNMYGCNCEKDDGQPAECYPVRTCVKNSTRRSARLDTGLKEPDPGYNVEGIGRVSVHTINAALRFINVNFDEDYTSLSCEDVDKFETKNRNALFTNEAKDYACRLKVVDRPDWFRIIDSNGDGIIQLSEFDKDLGNTPGVLQLIAQLRNQNGLIKINLGNCTRSITRQPPTQAPRTPRTPEIRQKKDCGCECLGVQEYKDHKPAPSCKSPSPREFRGGKWCFVHNSSNCIDKQEFGDGQYISHVACTSRDCRECRDEKKYCTAKGGVDNLFCTSHPVRAIKECPKQCGFCGDKIDHRLPKKIKEFKLNCIDSMVCDKWWGGTDECVKLEIDFKDGTSCRTNLLNKEEKVEDWKKPKNWLTHDDWERGKAQRFCGKEFLGPCFGKTVVYTTEVEKVPIVTIVMSRNSWWGDLTLDELCLKTVLLTSEPMDGTLYRTKAAVKNETILTPSACDKKDCSRSCETKKEHCCVFPFKYKGKTYTKCTTAGPELSGRYAHWCAHAIKTSGYMKQSGDMKQWDYCKDGCKLMDFKDARTKFLQGH